MRLLLILLLAACDDDIYPLSADLSSSMEQTVAPACTPACGAGEYCFGSDVGNVAFTTDAGAQNGCNPLPAGCSDCSCLFTFFNPAYCFCSSDQGRPYIGCTLL